LGGLAQAAAPVKLAFDTYSGYFVSNKFEPDAAESFLVIANQGQFDKVFGVGMVMGDKSHRLPKDAFKSNIVLAAIKRGKAVWEFKVERVTLEDAVVELRYTTTEKKSDSANFACPMIVSIPKGKYMAVRFVENGSAVRTVAIAKEPARQNLARPQEMKLWKEIDISPHKGTFPCLGDLDGDGKVDFLLYREGPQTTPGYMVALSHDGKKLWEIGDSSIKSHMPDGYANEPALRGIAFIYDIDQDGKSEVITEFWSDDRPMLYVLEGATGKIKHSRESPFNLKIRGEKRSRCHPVGRVAYLEGRDKPPAIVLVFGASNFVPGRVVALDSKLQTLWHLTLGRKSVAHMPVVGDINGDGKEDIVAGTAVVDANGKLLWEIPAKHHADCTAIGVAGPIKAVFMSICASGPAHCLSPQGKMIWEKTSTEVSHGQGIWLGNFIDKEPGQEAIICKSGHRGDYLTVRTKDGTNLASFQHRREKNGYPDFPCVVNWLGHGVQSLWIPIDRCVVDGYGNVVADLGSHEERVRQQLQWGTTKSHVAVQAFAVDLCGDERDELVLYQPYNGESIFIFTQPDSDGRAKPYDHQKSVYQILSYF
jgi:hypothetical protein